MRRVFFLALLTVILGMGCTRPPYSSPSKDLAAVDADFTDCYTLASLATNTPPYPNAPLWEVDRQADACMTTKGYQKHFRLF